jgi:hypothetical protein
VTLPIYIVTLQARHGDGIRSLRSLLKRLLRGSALRCLSVRQDHDHQFARHSASSSPAASSRSRNRATHEVNMRKSDAYPSKYFRAADLPDGWSLTAEIEMSRMEEFDSDTGGKVKKLVVYLVRQKSGLVVGSVVWDQLVAATGEDDSDAWKGHTVELYKTETPFGRKIVPCVRVRRADAPLKKPSKKAVVEASEEVPF